MSVGNWLHLGGAAITSLPKGMSVGGVLNLSYTAITSLPEDLAVGGALNLAYTSIEVLPKRLAVSGSLNLTGTRVTSLPNGFAVGGDLNLAHTPIEALPEDLTVGGTLNLGGTRIKALPNGLTVGGTLDLRGTKIESLPENLAVGGDLHLEHTAIALLPESLAVGGKLHPNGACAEGKPPRKLQDGDYVPGRYLYVDRALTRVKCVKHVGQYTVYVGKAKGHNVVSDGKHYARCGELRKGIADLAFKAAADRGVGQYKSLSLDDEIPIDEAKTMYRVITNARQECTDDFIARLGDKRKDRYTIREMLALTEGRYGHGMFATFFGQ